jgi:hypothetical protein
LTIEFEAKNEFASSLENSDGIKGLFQICNTSCQVPNSVQLGVYSGSVYFDTIDVSGTERYAVTTPDIVDFSEWNKYKFYIDFANFANTKGYINGTSVLGTFASASTAFDTTTTLIKPGYYKNIAGYCSIKNLKIDVS